MLYTLGSSLPIPDPCEVYLKHPENNEGLGDQSTTRIIMAILQVSINYVCTSLSTQFPLSDFLGAAGTRNCLIIIFYSIIGQYVA